MKKIALVLVMTLSVMMSMAIYANTGNTTKKAVFPTTKSSQGSDSPAIRAANWVFISAQGPLSGSDGKPISADMKEQIKQVFDNLRVVAKAAGGEMDNIVKLTVYLTSLSDYSTLNQCMRQYFKKPFPARTTIQVLALPDGDQVEMDAVMILN